jgi:predicted RNA-binding protein YlqC (UPF0109 family)
MRELVEYLVKSLVDHPEDILIAEKEQDNDIAMELRVASEDLGKVIGKNGYTINAIRTVLQAAASSHKKRVRLDILE